MRNKCVANHVLFRDGIYYYVRRVPCDLSEFYTVNRLSFSLKTKSVSTAVRFSNSISQRLEDYWLGLRPQKMDIPNLFVDISSSLLPKLPSKASTNLGAIQRVVMWSQASSINYLVRHLVMKTLNWSWRFLFILFLLVVRWL